MDKLRGAMSNGTKSIVDFEWRFAGKYCQYQSIEYKLKIDKSFIMFHSNKIQSERWEQKWVLTPSRSKHGLV